MYIREALVKVCGVPHVITLSFHGQLNRLSLQSFSDRCLWVFLREFCTDKPASNRRTMSIFGSLGFGILSFSGLFHLSSPSESGKFFTHSLNA